MKEDDVLTFLILGSISDHIFGSKKDKLFCPVFVFRRGMSNAICDLVLYLQSERPFHEYILVQFHSSTYKNGILNTAFYSVANRRPVYFSKVR